MLYPLVVPPKMLLPSGKLKNETTPSHNALLGTLGHLSCGMVPSGTPHRYRCAGLFLCTGATSTLGPFSHPDSASP